MGAGTSKEPSDLQPQSASSAPRPTPPPTRKGPQPCPPSELDPGFPWSCCSPFSTGLRLSSALRLPRARSPANSTVSVVLTKSSSSRTVK